MTPIKALWLHSLARYLKIMNIKTYAIHRSDRTPGWGICIGWCFLYILRRFCMGTLGMKSIFIV